MDAFEIGFQDAMDKLAGTSNPAQPVKSSMGTGYPEGQRFAPYLNQGGGMAAQQTAGEVQKHPQPWPGHVNIGDKKPGTQEPGFVNRHGSPDTGELGMGQGGDMTVTKSAAFEAGISSVFVDDDE